MPPTPSGASLQYGLPYSIWQAIIIDPSRNALRKLGLCRGEMSVRLFVTCRYCVETNIFSNLFTVW